jgi:opacity protein-like surface antigen
MMTRNNIYTCKLRCRWWVCVCLWTGLILPSDAAFAESYIAGQLGVNFADRLEDVDGTGNLAGLQAPDFDLKNSLTYGAKIGHFFNNSYFGLEGDVFHTSPHIKNLGNIPGIHFRVTSAMVNVIVRYPGLTYQPYIGFGGGLVVAHIGDSATTRSETDFTGGWNLLAGFRAFLTPSVALFTEYKYTGATVSFDDTFASNQGFIANYRSQQVLMGLSYHF